MIFKVIKATVALVIITSAAYAQIIQKEETLIFHGYQLKKIDSCEYNNDNIRKGLEFVQWIDLEKFPPQFREKTISTFKSRTEQNLQPSKIREINGVSFSGNVSATLYISEKNDKKRYHLYFVHEINKHPIILYIGLIENPKKNANIPAFISPFFQLN